MNKISQHLERIILIRHADSLDREIFAKKNNNDLERPLSKEGKKQSKKIAKFLKKLHSRVPFSSVLFSSAKRTTQTIKPFAKKHKNLCKKCDLILPECGIEGYLKAIQSVNANTIVLVGHQFDLGNFIEYATSKQNLNFKKGVVVELTRKKGVNEAKGGFQLTLLITPEYL